MLGLSWYDHTSYFVVGDKKSIDKVYGALLKANSINHDVIESIRIRAIECGPALDPETMQVIKEK